MPNRHAPFDNRSTITGIVSQPEVPTDPPPNLPPAMPTTAKDSTWALHWSQDFNTPVQEGLFMAAGSPYAIAPSATNIGNGPFYAYTYPTYKDTRNKSKRTVTINTVAGSTTITSSGAFVLSGSTYYWDSKRPYLENPSSAFNPPTQFSGSSPVRIETCTSTSTATVSRAATSTGSFSVVIRADYGYYDEKAYSVADGVLSLHIRTTADGRHHVGAIHPKINNLASGQQRDVLGGRFTICMKVPVALPGYKVAYLLWPESNTSNPDGEIDWPEQNLDGLGTATTFMHWQVIAGNTGQSSAGSSVDLVDALDWKVFDIEWRPNQANPASSTLKTHVDGVLIGNFTGVKVPIHRMHWSWQNETFLTHSGMIDDTSDGYLQVAWGTYETMV